MVGTSLANAASLSELVAETLSARAKLPYAVIEKSSFPRRRLIAALALGASVITLASAFAQPVPTFEAAAPAPPSNADKVKALKATSAYGFALEPNALGDFSRDLVYTPLTPCRIVDTRNAVGPLQANVTRTYDADGTTFASQGGYNGSCGVPYGVASAVALSIHVVGPSGVGALYAWGLGTKPAGSIMNYVTGQNIATNGIVPIVPGSGADFSISAQTSTQVAIDVVGYFAAPIATALNCISAASAIVSIPYNAYTAVDAICPAGYSATGGGTFPIEGTISRANIWIDGSPTVANGWRSWIDNQTGSSRSVQTYAVCCRIPGR